MKMLRLAMLLLLSTFLFGFRYDTPTQEQLNKVRELFNQNNITLDDSLQIVGVSFDEKSHHNVYHVYCEQFYKGLPIIFGTIGFHFDKNGKMPTRVENPKEIYTSGDWIKPGEINIATSPQTTKDEAESIYKDYIAKDRRMVRSKIEDISTVLGVENIKGGISNAKPLYALVWFIKNAARNYPYIIIDAMTAKVYSYDNGIRE